MSLCCIITKCKCKRKHSIQTINLTSIVCINENIDKEIKSYNKKLNKYKYAINCKKIYNDDECIICFNKFNPKDIVKLLYCKHLFHKECLDTWFKKKTSCPICNTNIV